MISSSRLSLVSVLMMMMVSVVNASSFFNNIRKPLPSFITSSSLSSWNNALNIRGGEVTQVDTMEDLNSIIFMASASGKLVVIDFSATWCPPCKAIFPLYQELSEEFDEDSAIFLKVDVDENPEAAANFQVSAMPTFLFIKGGEVIDRMMGADPNKLQALIQEYS